MKINCDTERYIDEVVIGGEYDFLFKDLVVVDVGCNVGTFSLLMSPLSQQIHAIDIAGENIDNLNATIQENNITNIKTYHCGISGRSERRNYKLDPDQGLGGSMLDREGESSIETYAFADFMSAHGIKHVDVLKIDIEGAELEVISSPTFPKERITTILGEIHYGDIKIRDEFRNRMEAFGYIYTEYPNNKFIARK